MVFGNKCCDINPYGFYVYLHRKLETGEVFYVGKGKGDRAWEKRRRGSYKWKVMAEKYGVMVEIYRDRLTEKEAYELESQVINDMRSDGVNLANLSDGGKGSRGHVSGQRKDLYCSNGMKFCSGSSAADWVSKAVNIGSTMKAISSAISACARGDSSSAYGLNWSYISTPPGGSSVVKSKNGTGHQLNGVRRRVPVVSDCGLEFNSAQTAAQWLVANGNTRARGTDVTRCCKGKAASVYGYKWSYK